MNGATSSPTGSGGLPGRVFGLRQVAVAVARCVLAVRRGDRLAAEHHGIAAQKLIAALERAESGYRDD
jgi:hypothetical protein